MKVVIKARPQDFVVQENAALPFVKKGPFSAYLLSKTGWNTVELLREIARKSDIPVSAFAYGGRKDRHSQSTQYITVKSPKSLLLKTD